MQPPVFELVAATVHRTVAFEFFKSVAAQKNNQDRMVLVIFWSCQPDLNWRPHPYQGCALPAELQQHVSQTACVLYRRVRKLSTLFCVFFDTFFTEKTPPSTGGKVTYRAGPKDGMNTTALCTHCQQALPAKKPCLQQGSNETEQAQRL